MKMRNMSRCLRGWPLLILLVAGCAPLGQVREARNTAAVFRADHPALGARGRGLDLFISDRRPVRTRSGVDLMRVDFSFISYDDYLAEGDQHRSTGAVFLTVDDDGEPMASRLPVALVTEYPPGSSRTGFPFFEEYGERPAAELGLVSAVVDIRGPIVSGLRDFQNPDDPLGGPFTSEEQFAYSMLRSYEETGSFDLLWEEQAAGAWIRAVSALREVIRRELGAEYPRFLLAGQGWGALAAAQAAAQDERVEGAVVAGWPLDWTDYHFVRWRRWERRGGYYPLGALSPTIWGDSREVLSFLSSSRGNPDPGCPTCEGDGLRWRRQYDLSELRRTGALDAALFVLESDADPDLPVDLLARASAPSDEIHSLPRANGPQEFQGPFSTPRALPLDDLRVLRDGTSSLARPDAAEAVRAWGQHLAGYRDVPFVRVAEEVQDGDLLVTVFVGEGNAPVTEVTLRTMEVDPLDAFDFKARRHLREPEPMAWRDIPVHYDGHGADFAGHWVGRFPLLAGTNQAYYVLVRSRVGDAVTEHSLPIRPLWHRGDPAQGPARP